MFCLFQIAENDDLPHKICFRCSAKVEELHEFINKCMNTQQSLHTALGKKEPLAMKSKTRAMWEEKLNKSNISNDDICDALIKKAMEGIKDIPLNPVPLQEKEISAPPKKLSKSKSDTQPIKKEPKNTSDAELKSDSEIEPVKQMKLTLDQCEKKFLPTRTSRSQNPEALLDGLPDYKRHIKKPSSKQSEPKVQVPMSRTKKKVYKESSSEAEEVSSDNDIIKHPPKQKEEEPKPVEPVKPVEPPKPFNIMDHVSIIKVNGFGILYQCKLCNRNFLKKDVLNSHGCAKNGGVPKVDFSKNIVPVEPPKATAVVKYINTKIDGELGKPVEKPVDKPVDKPVSVKSEVEVKKPPETKPKTRIGPASRVKRDNKNPMIGMRVAPMDEPPEEPAPTPEPPPTVPSVQFPSIPSLNSRYKLVPGPNNTFQLIEEGESNNPSKSNLEVNSKPSKKRKSDEPAKVSEPKSRKNVNELSQKKKSYEVINLDDSPNTERSEKTDMPYPVGLFSTLAHHSSIYQPPAAPTAPPSFTTPAMKKQSYTIVQTGNPSKLLISTKPQPPVEEPVKKRQRKSKQEIREDETEEKEPFKVTLEDSVPPKDSFFTFINVDPLLQPSYVLPTDNIIQESQISTSTPASKSQVENKDKDNKKYSCNMCDESFSREKKLLAHIHSHYNKMDEEDMLREKNKKRGKK